MIAATKLTALGRAAAVLAALIAHACLTAPTVRADDGAIGMSGGAIVSLREHPTVQMVAEFVHAWVWQDSVRVEGVFFLRNHGPRTTVLTGFPCFVDRSGESTLHWFRSEVDGVEVSTTLMHDSLGVDDDWVRGWWVKEIPLAAYATHTARVSYVESPGSFFGAQAYDDTTDRMRDSSFEYTLWSGASWRGPIGTIDLVVTLMEPDETLVYSADPEPAGRSANEIRWHFSNVDPGSAGAAGNVRLEWRRRTRAHE